MEKQLTDERLRLIYRYMQDSGTAPEFASPEAKARALPRPLPDAAMISSEPPERGPSYVVRSAAAPSVPLWRRQLLHLRRRLPAVGLVAFASAIGWLAAHAAG